MYGGLDTCTSFGPKPFWWRLANFIGCGEVQYAAQARNIRFVQMSCARNGVAYLRGSAQQRDDWRRRLISYLVMCPETSGQHDRDDSSPSNGQLRTSIFDRSHSPRLETEVGGEDHLFISRAHTANGRCTLLYIGMLKLPAWRGNLKAG